METHYHFIVWAYERIEAGTGNYIDNVVLDLISPSPEHALQRAKTLAPKKGGYCVRSIIEHFEGACTRSHS